VINTPYFVINTPYFGYRPPGRNYSKVPAKGLINQRESMPKFAAVLFPHFLVPERAKVEVLVCSTVVWSNLPLT
jgi:hypothetical protein